MSEEKLWRRVKPGAKTKEEFEKGELKQDGRPASIEELSQTFSKVRRIKTTELKTREKEKKVTETPKSQEEIEFIGMVQMMIMKERERLSLSRGFFVELEETRLFHPDQWSLREGYTADARGQYRTVEGLAETQTPVPGSEISPYAFFRTISHELLHQASHYEADPLSPGGMRGRIGYFNHMDGLGRALNEAMTEGINQQLLVEHAKTLGSRFPQEINGRPFEWWSEFPTYGIYRKIVKRVAEKVDAALYKGVPTTWDNLERGYFEGDNKALDDIEKAMGKESLELLLLLGNPALFDTEAPYFQTSYRDVEFEIERLLMAPLEGQQRLSPAQKRGIYKFVMSRRKKPTQAPGGDVISK
ncbi:MAG: hypothetical protein Q7R90_00915 [bacterium]|nr:hypothetical protein [bacterium]